MKKLILTVLILGCIILAEKTPKSLQPFLDNKVFIEKDCFEYTDSLGVTQHFYQIAFIDGSGSFGFGIEPTLKTKGLKEIADSVQARAYRQRNKD